MHLILKNLLEMCFSQKLLWSMYILFNVIGEFIFTECNSWCVCPSIPKKVGQWENFKGKTTTEMEVFLSSTLEFTKEQNSLWSFFWKFKNQAWLFSFSERDGDILWTMTSRGHYFSKWVTSRGYSQRVTFCGHFWWHLMYNFS